MFGSTSISSTMSPMKSASGMPHRGLVFAQDDDALVLLGDAQLEVGQTIASLGTPRILVGFSSLRLLGVAWPSQ